MRDHRSLHAWQRARELVISVHRLAKGIWHPSLAPIINQLRRASLSVQLNIAEGQALGGARQFARHLTVAYGSAIESVELLELLEELTDRGDGELAALTERARRNCALVLALKRSVARRRWFGAEEGIVTSERARRDPEGSRTASQRLTAHGSRLTERARLAASPVHYSVQCRLTSDSPAPTEPATSFPARPSVPSRSSPSRTG
jgi:four helix bundle protein